MKKNLAISIDLGASNLRAAVVSKNGKILKCLKIKTPKKSEVIALKNLIVLINVLIENVSKQKIKGIALSAGSPVNQEGLLNPPNLPFKKLALRKPLEKYFKLPVLISNDCKAGVYGEKIFGAGEACLPAGRPRLSAGREYKNIVYITISSGIGGGAIVDNHLLSGQSNNAAEIGHFIIDTKYNLPCGCGRGRGHWEAMCSGTNLPKFFRAWLKLRNEARPHQRGQASLKNAVKTSADIFELADKKDKTILNFLKEVGKMNGRGISNVIAAYNPELITLGGAVVLENKKHILPYLKKNVDKFLETPKIISTPLKENIVLLGGAALIFYPKN